VIGLAEISHEQGKIFDGSWAVTIVNVAPTWPRRRRGAFPMLDDVRRLPAAFEGEAKAALPMSASRCHGIAATPQPTSRPLFFTTTIRRAIKPRRVDWGRRSATRFCHNDYVGIDHRHHFATASQPPPANVWPLAPLQKLGRDTADTFVPVTTANGNGRHGDYSALPTVILEPPRFCRRRQHRCVRRCRRS
jgi:hypothetical protein